MKFIIYVIVFIALILTSLFVVVDIIPAKIVPILMYNHVTMGEEENTLVTSPRNFEWQLKYLWKNKLKVISFEQLLNYYKKKQMPPKRSVVITFNGGYGDFFGSAYSLLRKYKMPATVFIEANKVNTPGYLTSKQIIDMHSKGLITFGSQGTKGEILTRISQQDAYNEIFYSKQKLEEIFEFTIPFKYFAYPDGKYNKRIIGITKECRYSGACTTDPGRKYPDKNIFALKRTDVWNKDANVWSFKLKVWGNFVIVREWIREKIGK